MSTFLYSPQIRVRVATARKGILDISDDLVQGSLTIRTNAVHTFSFQIQNALRKYDGIIRPMDRIVVEMKRVTWVRVFSGYLNNGPIFSVWPRVLNLTASCTLKRLQFWYWDSTTSASRNLLTANMNSNGTAIVDSQQHTVTSPTGGATQGDQSPAGASVTGSATITASDVTGHDASVRQTTVKILTEVVGWPQEKVHIAEVPSDWYKLAEELYQQIWKDVDVSDLIGDFASGGTIAGTAIGGAAGANGTLTPGVYGGTTYSQEQANNAAIIYNVAASRGLPAQAAVIAIATAWQESSMRSLAGGDRDSAGLFQQRPSQGWGTLAQVTDPTYAAGKFFDALVKIPNWQSLAVTVAAQQVQRSAFPSAYAKWEGTAKAAVAALQATAGGSAAGSTSTGSGTASPGSTGGGTATAAGGGSGSAPVGSGRNVALVGANLINGHEAGHIRYSLGGDDAYSVADPRVLDCSSFVDWVYYHAIGRPWLTPRGTAARQQSASKRVSVATAKATKGALLFVGSPAHHVEISLGNGMTAAAHTDGVPLAQQVTVSDAGNGWTNAGLMPGVDYKDAATTQGAAAELSQILGITTSVSDPSEAGSGTLAGGGAAATGATGPDGNAAFNAFVNVYVWGLQPSVTGDLLAGAKALLNDEPMLPYIANLMASVMRSWCSAPNGDFMAWFPDYFGLWDSAAKMNVKSIELQDFTVEWYDQEIVTHQYVIGAPLSMFDTATASVSGQSGSSSSGGLAWIFMSQGVATMDYPEIFKALFGVAASQQFIDEYLDRFGGRPNVVNMPSVPSGTANEFFMSLYLFMQRWANQFRADIPMTFMPELWPGMLLVLPEYEFQAYITEVNHTFRFGPGGGFNTTAKVCAPARTSQKTDIFGLLPLSGSAR